MTALPDDQLIKDANGNPDRTPFGKMYALFSSGRTFNNGQIVQSGGDAAGLRADLLKRKPGSTLPPMIGKSGGNPYVKAQSLITQNWNK